MLKIGLVGATNVGKSLLFNELLGTHRAIVTDIPGTTRELLRDDVQRAGVPLQLIDSPGVFDFSEEVIYLEQIIKEADILLFVVNGKDAIGSKELEIHQMILREGKFGKTILAVNKLDGKVYTKEAAVIVAPRYELGYEEIVPVSAAQYEGIGELKEKILHYLKTFGDRIAQTTKKSTQDLIHLAIIGRPNTGKSTLLNKLIGEEISFVSEMPGTTLDYLTAEFQWKGKNIKLYDTAGIRKKGRIHGLERIAYEKTKSLLTYIHPITVMLVDLEEGLTKRDASLLQEVVEIGIPLILAVNKIDLFSMDETKYKIKQLQQAVKIPSRVPIVPISAHHAIGLPKLMQMVTQIHTIWHQRIDTAQLNRAVTKASISKPPRFPKNKICKRKYITQVWTAPPTFMVSINKKDYANFSFQSRMEKVIREAFGFIGVPIKFQRKEKIGDNPYTKN